MTSSSKPQVTIKIPSNNDFDQATAKELLKYCAAMVVENFPVGSEFGIDLSIHYTGKNFLGLKMIPPGLHLIHFSLVHTKTGLVGPRISFFHYFSSEDFLAVKWDDREEDLILDQVDTERVASLKDSFNKGYLDAQLGAYQFDQYQSWVSLSDYITKDIFERMNPLCGKIFSASSLVYKPNEDGSQVQTNRFCDLRNKVDSQGLPDMVVAPEAVVRFISEVPKRFLYPEGSTASEITRHSLDSSFTLDFLICHYHDNHELDLLGELQFAFIIFLLGHQFEAFESWRDIIKIICSARSSLTKRNNFFLAFIRVFHFQLKQISNNEMLLEISDCEESLFHSILRTLFLNFKHESSFITKQLRERGEKFQNFLMKSIKWKLFDDLEEEPESERPVIVDFIQN